MARSKPPAPSSRRAAPTKVSKPFPWGTVLASLVLAVALIGTVTYAALNQGSGVSDLQRNPDQAIEGLQVTAREELSRNHVPGAVPYEQAPPTGGDHNIVPQQCAVYDAPIAPEHAVHSLEHGAVWITYADGLSDSDVQTLAGKATGEPYLMVSPLPEQDSPVVMTAWGRQLRLDSASDSRVDDFITAYASGPQTPEQGAACVGNTTTGPLAAAPPQLLPAPAPSAQAPAPSGAAPAPGAPAPAPEAPAPGASPATG